VSIGNGKSASVYESHRNDNGQLAPTGVRVEKVDTTELILTRSVWQKSRSAA
jgi:hypothetical protein